MLCVREAGHGERCRDLGEDLKIGVSDFLKDGVSKLGERGKNMTCDKCGSEFTLKDLKRTNGKCPKCGEVLPVSKYCHIVPEEHFWKLYSNAPLSIRVCCVLWGGCLLALLGIAVGFCYRMTNPDLSPEKGFPVIAFALGCLLVQWGLGALVRGKWVFPTIAAILLMSGFAVLLRGPGIAFALVATGGGLIPLMSSSARKWRWKCEEERRAYDMAQKGGGDLAGVKDHGYECRPLAIILVLVVMGACAFVGVWRGMDVAVSCQRQAEMAIDQMNEDWKDSGIIEFLADPKPCLVATNDVGTMLKMLGRGFESSSEALDGQWFVFAFADENPRVGACKLVAAQYACLFVSAMSIVMRCDQLDKGDPNGTLREEFGTADLKAIAEKLEAKRVECLERYVKILEILARARTGDDQETP